MLIREATRDDVSAMVALGRRMHEESPYWSALPFSDERTAATIVQLMAAPGLGVAFVAEHDGQIVGGAGAVIVWHWSVAAKIGCELFVFVAPEHRGGSVAARLIRAMDRAVAARGAVRFQVGSSIGLNDERTAQLYERLGFRRYSIGLEKAY